MLNNNEIEKLLNRPMAAVNFGSQYIYENENIYSKRCQKIKSMLMPKKVLNTKFKNYGSYHDGGYILAEDININDGLISLGVESNVTFEESLQSNLKFIHTYDFSVDNTPVVLKNNIFFKEKIGFEEFGNTNLKKILSRATDYKDLILKVDIELGEYPLFIEAESDDLNKFRQIIVEFHELIALKDENMFNVINLALEKITQTHIPVWIHGNNYSPMFIAGNHVIPSVIEVLFLRKNSYEYTEYINEYSDIFSKLRGPNYSIAEEIRLNFNDL